MQFLLNFALAVFLSSKMFVTCNLTEHDNQAAFTHENHQLVKQFQAFCAPRLKTTLLFQNLKKNLSLRLHQNCNVTQVLHFRFLVPLIRCLPLDRPWKLAPPYSLQASLPLLFPN